MTHRKKSVTRTVANERATPYQMRRMADMIHYIRKEHGYRWIAKFTTRSFGYWQHVATGDKQCKPRVDDYNRIKMIYGILIDGAAMDSEMVRLLLEVMEYRGQMDAALARLLNLVRRKETQNE